MYEMQTTGYKKLVVYQKSKELVINIYKLTSNYPKGEKYSLVDQMRRSAMSVPANLIEGYSKESSAEFARFLTISIGSLAELEFYIDISLDLNYLKLNDFNIISSLMYEIKKLLYGTRKSARLKINNKL